MRSTLSDFAARLREFIRDPGSDANFNDLALELFALQFENNEAYQRFCKSRGVPPTGLSHWSQIPCWPTSAFKEWDVTSLAPAQRQKTFLSSGTTEQRPSRHFHSSESLEIYEASLWPWFERHLLSENRDRIELLSLTPSAEAAPNSSLVFMFETIHQRFSDNGRRSAFVGRVADGSWKIAFNAAIQFLQRAMADKTPVLIMGTAFNFVHLIDHLVSVGGRVALPSGSRVLETGGYKGRSRIIPKVELHDLISEHLGIAKSRIITEYGMTELSSQAYDDVVGTPGPRLFQFPPWARAQIISHETGEAVAPGQTGLIRVFDLANVWSVMGIQTEDLAIEHEAGFELLGRAESAELRGCSLMASQP